jgi:glycosyltransferase involved in cell wall biosynthesis
VGGGDWSVIYNCARPSVYVPRFDVDAASAPLAFLGRLEQCKGPHNAIAVARLLCRKLIVAGNIPTLPHEREYFAREVEPHFHDPLIDYIGPVADAAKNELLRNAAALLSPIEWEEPFPLIIPEALLCGTPVIAFARGGMPEGIDHGRTGFLCDTVDQMAACVRQLPQIDRRHCRAEGERRFSDATIIGDYVSLYERMQAA